MRKIRKKSLLTSSAIITTAMVVGSIAMAGSVKAQDYTLPQNGNVTYGTTTIDTSQSSSGIMNVNQSSAVTSIDWDSFNIGLDASVTFNQPNSSAIAVNRVVGQGTNPTQILGRLSANGQLMVLDGNGVFFGNNAQIDASGLLVSTGDIQNFNDVLLGAAPIISNFGNGSIENNGNITIADYGLAAFAAAKIVNNGNITVHRGTVTMAGGDTVTLDLFGDGLLSIDVTNPSTIIQNNGVINASSLNNIINDTIYVDTPQVASASVIGGKIVLRAENVETSGILNTDGQEGGGVVTIDAGNDAKNTGVITANALGSGNGGIVNIESDLWARHEGSIEAKGIATGNGGQLVLSGDFVGYKGLTNLDGVNDGFINIITDRPYLRNGALTSASYIDTASLTNSLRTSNVNITANDKIVIGQAIDLSTWVDGANTGLVTNEIEMNAPRLDLLDNVIITSNLYDLNIDKMKLEAKLMFKDAVGASPVLPNINIHSINMTTEASRVDVRNNNALISQAASLGDDNAKIYVAAGTYNDIVGAYKIGQRFFGANAWTDGDGARGQETTIIAYPGYASFGVYADNVEINGFELTGGQTGISVLNGADNTVIKYNNIHGQYVPSGGNGSTFAILSGANNVLVQGNWLYDTDYGLHNYGINGVNVKDNKIENVIYDAINIANTDNAIIKNNIVNNAGRYGVVRHTAGDNAQIRGNSINGVGLYGIYNQFGSNATIRNNVIDDSAIGIYLYKNVNSYTADNVVSNISSSGIYSRESDGLVFKNNEVYNAGIYGITGQKNTNSVYKYNIVDDTVWSSYFFGNEVNSIIKYNVSSNPNNTGFSFLEGSNLTVSNNDISNFRTDSLFSGINAYLVDNISIKYNNITGSGNTGIYLNRVTGDAYVEHNNINKYETDATNALTGDGIFVNDSDNTRIRYNDISYVNGNGIRTANSSGIKIDGNIISNTVSNGIYTGALTASYIRNNVIDNVTGYGIDYNLSGASLSGNVFSNTGLGDINTH